jgi:RNA polymerase sigma factor (sigma-70 family)
MKGSEQNNQSTDAEKDIYQWNAFLQGDQNALGILFSQYYPDLFKYGLKICGGDTEILEDCIQELFIEIWQHKNPPPAVSVKAYLLKAVKYKLLKAMYKKSNTIAIETAPFEISYESFIIARQEDDEKIKKVVTAIEQLSNRQKEIIYLKFYQNLNYEEVSDIMNINYQAARNLLHQAIKSMKKILQQAYSFLPCIVY